ncbi:3367_t:CDS:2 [Acaulospora morrowiae]|uniref:3367_t:CDS:1 n=1 Tax=Acaulospora morrowiae TaxID=94023 RepID=A0A9N9G950_9GLOM|nr:3367_t:CDS:2 [Acaulospora morrowiae]
MSNLTLFNSSGSMPFLTLSAVFLLVSPVIFMGFAVKYQTENLINSARAIEIVDDRDTPEIEKSFTEFNDKLAAKVFTSNSNFKFTFIAEIRSSNLSGILDITSDIKIRFKQQFDRLLKARNYTYDEMCFSVVIDICSLGGNIMISTVKIFYNGVSGSKPAGPFSYVTMKIFKEDEDNEPSSTSTWPIDRLNEDNTEIEPIKRVVDIVYIPEGTTPPSCYQFERQDEPENMRFVGDQVRDNPYTPHQLKLSLLIIL